jgi:hypothetical protein
MRSASLKVAALLVLALMALTSLGCGEARSPYAGTYRSEKPFAGKGHIELVLKENGECTWKLEQDSKTLKLKWKAEGDRLWLYTREGALMIATATDGGKRLSLDMSGDWNPSCPIEQCVTFVKVSGGG